MRCGAGSLTIEPAEHVAPRELVGMDVEPRAMEQGRESAAARAAGNVRFEQGDAYVAGDGWGTAARARAVATAFAAQAHAAEFVRTVVDQGWATEVEMAGLPEGLLAWGEMPLGLSAA